MFCPRCGAEANGAFCPKCGLKMPQSGETGAAAQPAQAQPTQPQPASGAYTCGAAQTAQAQPTQPQFAAGAYTCGAAQTAQAQPVQRVYPYGVPGQTPAAPKAKKSLFRRWWFWVGAALLLFILIGLFAPKSKSGDTAAADGKTESAAEAPQTAATAQPQTSFAETTLADNDQITVRCTEFDPEAVFGPSFTVYIENKTDKTLMYSLDYVSVDGVMCEPLFAVEVAPGKSSYEDLYWSSETLAQNGIRYVDTVEGILHVYDSQDWSADPVWNDAFRLQVTNTGRSGDPAAAPAFSHGYTPVVLAENESVRVTVVDYDAKAFWGPTFTLCIENKTDRNLMCAIENTSVDGLMCDPFWADTVAAGKTLYSTMSWSEQTMQDSHVTAIGKVEGTLRIYDADNWSAANLFDGTVTFAAN